MKPSAGGAKHRNTPFVIKESSDRFNRAVQSNLMQVTIKGRNGKHVLLPDGRDVVEFVNCSYLGLDVHPSVIEASKSVDETWGMNFCCARSRFSIEPQRELEEELSELYRGRVITFPSTTAAHISVMPLLASGVLVDEDTTHRMCLIFDQFAHSSMQYLKPVVAAEATVETVRHNALDDLAQQVRQARERGEVPVYIADGIYSMGGLCPVRELLDLAERLDFSVYIDDAHGMTIFGDRGEGVVLSEVEGDVPDRLILTYSLSKGFGAYGGGLLVAGEWRERLIRSYGQIYAFSAAQTFQAVHACRAVVGLHRDGTVQQLQGALRERVTLFDELMGQQLPFSPIRMVPIGGEEDALRAGEWLLDEGYYVSVVFFPIVRRGAAQLRVCLAANHTPDDIRGLTAALRRVRTSSA
ncbi:aminotransferase class I/II-fold pyridoxal phosphate-dependent enzyme [Streptomyces sp. NA02950]|uniref:aminotransferase class I/II-fold pyridoxal phosphate-dependent enzyme n=1 Tax=Streptomyces sp. NA02950 TaxID=2742137 RepID=UPI001591B2B3|nr:aminotransferase class I/II-fold pyridoxal phosphate-dependent enzyme [Streptomyces sp. NA02950]QKV96303.1 aminotransferase class I/II-fold pyridoxal phosphate-dependent enzyme [Streptomyces sp. NA02950]